jgi:AraC family transcriptional regulator, exoenzyme S synthesis regulatory protein ExsA
MLATDNCSNHAFLKDHIPGLSDVSGFRHVLHYPNFEGDVFIKENLLLFVEKGDISFNHGQTVYRVSKQELVFIKKNVLLQYRCNDTADFVVFVLKNELVIEFAKLAQLNAGSHPGNCGMLAVGGSTDSLQAYVSSLQPYILCGGTIQESLAKIKLLELLFCLSENNHPLLTQILDVREQLHNDVTQVVEENIMNALSLNQLAKLAGRSVSSFRRDFLSIYNMPPSRWIRQKKLEKAQELLVSTSMTVTSICYTLGFQSIAHFSRLFKSHFGYPPTNSRSNSMVA